MRTLIVITLVTPVLVGCTVKETVVEPASPAAVYQPAPTVVYQSPPTVVSRRRSPTLSRIRCSTTKRQCLPANGCAHGSVLVRAYDTKQATSPGLARHSHA
jgi:hypothetical protein